MTRKVDEQTRLNFAVRLDKALREIGLSRQALATELGVKKATVDSWTRSLANIPDRATLQALCVLLEGRKAELGCAVAEAAGVVWMPTCTPTAMIPAALNGFWGRQDEVRRIQELLYKQRRLITLTGPGGSGKTRLALEAARSIQSTFADGAFVVYLDALRDPDLLAETIARSVGVPESAREPIKQSLQRFLGPKHLLLILDNFEQILAAASLVKDLLEAAPHLYILVTSRAPLLPTWEQQFMVNPLPVPQSEQPYPELDDNPAVQLFVDRAGQCDLHLAFCAPIDAE